MRIQIIILTLLMITGLAAETYYVPSDYLEIQSGIDNIENGDTLLVSPGVYHENIDYLGKNITVASLYYTTQDTCYISQTIIDGSNAGSVVTIEGVEQGTAVLSGLTIQNGHAQSGGGIYCPLSDIELSNLVVKNNQVGGGFIDYYGGGLYLWNSSGSLSYLKVVNNSGESGGGLYSIHSDLEINALECDENQASMSGGGAYINGGNVNLRNSCFTGNSAQLGGGLYIFCNNSFLEGDTFTDNSATDSGGGIYNRSIMDFSMENRCNIYHNIVENRWGGSDFYSQQYVTVFADTFTVLSPTSYHAQPIEDFSFDILHGMLEQVDADLYVAPDGDNINTGISPENPLLTIQYACSIILADSLDYHTIHLAEGIYSPDTNGESFPVIIPDYVSLQGAGRDVTVLDAQNISGVIRLYYNSNISLSSLTLINGTDSEGAGIYSLDSFANFNDLAINNCLANDGGGIYLLMGNYTLSNMTISNNSASRGAGIQLSYVDSISMDNMVIENNQADVSGGGISIGGSEIDISNSFITNNFAQINGGGLFLNSNSVTSLSNVTISYNSSRQYGGGICSFADAGIVFDPIDRCSVFLNNSSLRAFGSDIFSDIPIEVMVDTFTVMNPTEYHTAPLENFSFDIQNSKQQQTAADLYVSPEGNNSNSGLSEDEPLQTIQCACSIILADSLNPLTINLLDGIYSYSANDEHFPVSLPDYVSLRGSSQENVILDAENNSSALRLFNSKNNSISNLTIINGYAAEGAGIFCSNSNPSLHHITLSSNSADDGDGGAMVIKDSSQVIMHEVIVQNNSAFSGGGIFLRNSSGTLQDVIIENNAASNYGGGIYGFHSDLSIHNAIFRGNFAAEFGGGIYCAESELLISNCLYYDNIALDVGAGICSYNHSIVVISNSTFTNNSAHSSSAIHSFLNSSLYAVNCNFWDNSPDVVRFFGTLPTDTFCLTYSNVQDGTENIVHGSVGLIHISEENINQDPLFISPQNDEFQLQSDSPCIDTGIDFFEYNDLLLVDLDETQYSGIAPDMGCYEYDPVETNELIIQNSELKIQNYPNPFNPSTKINFSLPETAATELTIYNIKGQLVRVLVNETLPAGNYTRIWNGCDKQNNALSSGIYLLFLKTNDSFRTQKITLLK
ncbi:MAG: DUF1565 domain-containing protein [Candidatus Cloacimonetes bacterium]|nr:DUF1565 domain-containing protein [Candidatus Cloacimonadota bacterium]